MNCSQQHRQHPNLCQTQPHYPHVVDCNSSSASPNSCAVFFCFHQNRYTSQAKQSKNKISAIKTHQNQFGNSSSSLPMPNTIAHKSESRATENHIVVGYMGSQSPKLVTESVHELTVKPNPNELDKHS